MLTVNFNSGKHFAGSRAQFLLPLYTIRPNVPTTYTSFKFSGTNQQGPMLTISKESALREAGNSALYVKHISRVSRKLLLVRVHTPRIHTPRYRAFFAYTAIWRLHSKRRMVITSAEFGSKQSHEIGPSRTSIWLLGQTQGVKQSSIRIC